MYTSKYNGGVGDGTQRRNNGMERDVRERERESCEHYDIDGAGLCKGINERNQG